MRSRDRLLRRRSDVRYRVIGDEAVVVRQDDAEVLVLNEVGARILDLVDGETTVDGLLGRLNEEFDAPAAELEADVDRFLDELEEAGVIEDAEAVSSP